MRLDGKTAVVTGAAAGAGLAPGQPQSAGTAPQARLVWTDTTPVRKDSDTGATNARIDQRNRDAAQVMQRLNISMDDQHTLMQPHVDMHSDDVHWNAAGSDLQAAQVAALVRKQLSR